MSRMQANGLLLLAAFLWGAGNVAQKTILNDLGPLTAVGLRCLIGALVIWPLLDSSRVQPHRNNRSDSSHSAAWGVIAVFSFASAITLQQISYGHTTVTNAGFLVNTCTVMTPLLLRLLLGQSSSRSVCVAAAMTFGGAALMSGGSLHGLNVGDAGVLLAAFFYALWIVAVGEFVTRHGGETVLTLMQFIVTGILCFSAGLIFEPVSFAAIANAAPELCMLGGFSTGFAYLLMATAQKVASASEAAVITSAEAIFGAIAGYAILGELLTPLSLVGSLLIFCGILLVQMPVREVMPQLARARLAANHLPIPKRDGDMR
jgi:drug/metabolite transporter (DMT)-like permease